MTEDRVTKAIELLERIVAHDHQGAATVNEEEIV